MESNLLKMDSALATLEERCQRVHEIIDNTPQEQLKPYYLEKLANYILFTEGKRSDENRRTKQLLTNNRMITVHQSETSFEGLIGKLENGEDGIYNMIANDKNILRTHKRPITPEDIAEVPGLRELREEIEKQEKRAKAARGKAAYTLRKHLIDMYKDQYVLLAAYKPMSFGSKNYTKTFLKIDLSEEIAEGPDGKVHSTGLINLFNPEHVSALLSNYSKIKEDVWDNFQDDIHWLMEDLDNLTDAALADKPLLYDLLVYKIDGKQNLEIQELLNEKYNIKYSVEHLSFLWKNKIPELIAKEQEKQWLIYHYTVETKGNWKKCNKCGQIKLAHNIFFSKNSASKDHFYSICKECRNKAHKEKKE